MNSVTHAVAAVPADSRAYRFERPRLSDMLHDMFIRRGELGPGDDIGSFSLETVDGRSFSNVSLRDEGLPALIVFGSRTCPVTESAAEGLPELHARYGTRVRFVMVQVREAHPGAIIPQPHSLDQKRDHARGLQEHYRLRFDVAVDDIDGTFHRRLGARPNSAFIVEAGGTILFRAQWANDTEALDEALAAVVRKAPLEHPSVARTIRAITRTVGYMSDVLRGAGPGAVRDTWLVAPPMALVMRAADLFFFLPKARRGAPAMALVGASVLAAIVALRQLF